VNQGLETIVGKWGKTTDKKLSRLCKRELASQYLHLCHATNNLSVLPDDKTKIFYDSLKNINTDYLAVKNALKMAFKLSNFGTWVEKPEELKTFKLNI